MLSRTDAQELGLTNGDTVTVSQNGVAVLLPVQVNRMVREGVALVPRNLPGRPAEKLLGPGALYGRVKIEKS
jgi:anaerobic selenocysteine-containing dehydrogenase